jgi:hypothetical protein
MWSITQEFRSAFADLFRTRRDVLIVLGVVFFGAIVSAAELLTAQLFSEIIIPSGSGDRSQNDTILLAVLFLGVFASLRFLNYAQSSGRAPGRGQTEWSAEPAGAPQRGALTR